MSLRLARAAVDDWQAFDGFAASQGLPDLEEMSPARFCNLVWWWLIRNVADPIDVDKVRARLWQPPKGVVPTPESPWSAENESKGFAALKASLGR